MARNRIARLNTNGSLDTTFNPGSGADDIVFSLALLPNGKILIGGNFFSYNGTICSGIARLNANGSLDTSFNPGTGTTGTVFSIAFQPDGKVLIGGVFFSYNGTARNRIARLNTDGSLDTTFNPGTGVLGGSFPGVNSLALQPDGKVLIGGYFFSYNGTSRNSIARLNADGSLDATFNPGTGANNEIKALALQPDGKVLIGGQFTSYNSISRNRIARLNGDGSLDSSFNPGTGASDIVFSFSLQPDGKVLIGGRFSSYNGTSRNSIARLNANGNLDSTFNPGIGTFDVYSLALQPDGKVIIGGSFGGYNGTTRIRIALVNPDGSLDISFNSGSGANSEVRSIAYQPDGKVLIGGFFTRYNDTVRNRIARLNSDGSLDTIFNTGTGANGTVQSLALQPDGKVLIGGEFTSYNGTTRNHIARLQADGSLDSSFNPGFGANARVESLALQPDGKVLIGGDFTSYNGSARVHIARLNADGSLDASFNPGTGVGGPFVLSLALQPNGKVLIGGQFFSYNGTSRKGIARVNADGSLDVGFNTGTGVFGAVTSLALQPDGKVLIGGNFFAYNDTYCNNIARLNADGSLDSTFNPGSGVNDIVWSFALQPDGKVLIGGAFTNYNGTPRNRIARLNAYGSLDATFNPGIGGNNLVRSLALQPDGKVLVGGAFSSYNGIYRSRIARVLSPNCINTITNTTDTISICNSKTKSLMGTPGGSWVIFSGPGSIMNSTYSALGVGTVSLYNEVGGCTSPLVTFTVNPLPSVPNTPAPAAICAGSTATITPTAGGANYRFYAASTGGSPLAGGNSVASFTTPTLTTTTTYHVASVSAVGCESSTRTAVTVTVNPLPSAPTAPAPAAICEGTTATITPTAGGANYRFYAASTGGSPFAGGNGVASFTTPTLTTNTTYHVASVSAAGCESSTRTSVSVAVNSLPIVNILQVVDTLKANSLPGSYQWLLNGAIVTGATSLNFVPTQSGLYTLRVTSPQGCIGISNAINFIVTGLETSSANSLTDWLAFPIPFQNELKIKAQGPFSYQIIDLRGVVHVSGLSEASEASFFTSDLASGMYLVRITLKGQTYVRKVVKE
jgi:uncharacterized delta-60 repeat protein